MNPSASSSARIAPTRPSIMSLGATMSAPARAWLTAARASSSSEASLSTPPSARTTPQWPWLVYSQRQTSVITTSSRVRGLDRADRELHRALVVPGARALRRPCGRGSRTASRPPTPSSASSPAAATAPRDRDARDAGHRLDRPAARRRRTAARPGAPGVSSVSRTRSRSARGPPQPPQARVGKRHPTDGTAPNDPPSKAPAKSPPPHNAPQAAPEQQSPPPPQPHPRATTKAANGGRTNVSTPRNRSAPRAIRLPRSPRRAAAGRPRRRRGSGAGGGRGRHGSSTTWRRR